MIADVVVSLILSGIIAVVPSAKNPNLTRLVGPKVAEATHGNMTVPEHFAYVEVHSKNLVMNGTDRPADFRYHSDADAPDDDRAVFILRSEELKFTKPNTNTKLTRNEKAPGALKNPEPSETTSSAYMLSVNRLCADCARVANDYFDVAKNPDKVALRMDLTGGRVRANRVNVSHSWTATGTDIDQPFAERVAYDFDVPGDTQSIKFIKTVGTKAEERTIRLRSRNGRPIEVVVGNSPFVNIIPRLEKDFLRSGGDHFLAYYDMFAPMPAARPELVDHASNNVTGPRTPCFQLILAAQDPE
jgi:hypothetical protein